MTWTELVPKTGSPYFSARAPSANVAVLDSTIFLSGADMWASKNGSTYEFLLVSVLNADALFLQIREGCGIIHDLNDSLVTFRELNSQE